MECVERGLVNSNEYFGLKFGDPESVIRGLNAIAHRQGKGNELAEGVRKLSEIIGKGSDRFAMHVKGLELPAYDPRAGFGTGLTYAITPRGGCHRRAWPPAKEILGNVPPYTTENKAGMVKEVMNSRAIVHSLVACDFHPDALPISLQEYRDFIKAAVGYTYSMEELDECAERIETTIRIFNNREGFTRADDTLPLRLLEDPLPDGPAKGQLVGKQGLNKMIDEYYELRGWDNEGVPFQETLTRLSIPVGG
jgi:aldehyde:ferredoxin oxidoreductase